MLVLFHCAILLALYNNKFLDFTQCFSLLSPLKKEILIFNGTGLSILTIRNQSDHWQNACAIPVTVTIVIPNCFHEFAFSPFATNLSILYSEKMHFVFVGNVFLVWNMALFTLFLIFYRLFYNFLWFCNVFTLKVARANHCDA